MTVHPDPRPLTSDPSAARHVSPWTLREKIGRYLWSWVEATLFRLSPQPCYRWRNFLLARFGARIHPTARLRPTVRIEVPWNLAIGANSSVGDYAILYCLGPITIGDRVTISQYAHLCAGTHRHSKRAMPLLRPPIEVGDDVWIAADAFIGPGVRIGEGTVVGARASAFEHLPPWTICMGNPARPVRERRLDD
jgi:putative colanic acid biosynthesis acetyltransferase WcaF